MDVDLHQLELRHDDLRIHDGARRRRLIASVAEIGQQVPVVVIADGDRWVLIDGYLRVEVLRRLKRDTAVATTWSMSEAEASLQHHHLTAASRHTAIEDAWLLARLRVHGLSVEDLARRLCRSKSWVSRRLALLDAVAAAVQSAVRVGVVPPHAACLGARAASAATARETVASSSGSSPPGPLSAPRTVTSTRTSITPARWCSMEGQRRRCYPRPSRLATISPLPRERLP